MSLWLEIAIGISFGIVGTALAAIGLLLFLGALMRNYD
jgi:hypothetical protein